jgi:ankyrin repeat protein
MGGYGPGAYFILNAAIRRNRPDVAEWALAHGANPNLPSGYTHRKFNPRWTLEQAARLMGRVAIADLLLAHGADPQHRPLQGEELFIAACMRLDRAEAARLAQEHPEYLRSHLAMFEAAKLDRPDVIALLLDLGVPLEIADKSNTRALHQAAAHNALRAAQFLIDRGAEIDPRETSWGATPIGWAGHHDHPEMLALLARYSRNVWTLAFRGLEERLREVLREQPELAKQVSPEGITPLWWLPEDESKAMAIVEMLLAAGADPAVKSRDGHTAADWAWNRGMMAVAQRLAVGNTPPSWEALPTPPG